MSDARTVPTLQPCNEKEFAYWKMKTLAALMAYGLVDVCETPHAVTLLAHERTARALAVHAAHATNKTEGTSASTHAHASASAHSSLQMDASEMGAPIPRKADATQEQEERHAQSMQASKRAYSALISSLSTTQLQLVQHVPTGDAYGVWQALLLHYERKSVATRVGLLEQLFSMEMSTESMSLYIARVQGLRRKLAEQEEVITDTVLLFVLLRGLPARYDTLVTLLKMRPLIVEEVVDALKNEEERQSHAHAEGGAGSGGERAFYAGSGGSRRFTPRTGVPPSGGAAHQRLQCFTCKEEGHIKFNCPMNRGKKKCERCHRLGHTVSECRAANDAAVSDAMYAASYAAHKEKFEEDDGVW